MLELKKKHTTVEEESRYLFFFLIEILVKLEFQNKNKSNLGIMLKMTNSNISILSAFLIKQLQSSFSKRGSVWYMCLKTENCCLKTFVEIRVGEKVY